MILDMKREVIELEYRTIVPVEDGAGTRIDCLHGQLWITEEGSTEDIVLWAGESYVISRGGVTVVQALQEALIGLQAPLVRKAGARVARLWNEFAVRATDVVSALAQPRAG